MRLIKFITGIFVILGLVCGCTRFDDSSAKEEVIDITALKEKIDNLNADIIALQQLVTTSRIQDYISDCTPLAGGSGYTVIFGSGKSIAIKPSQNSIYEKDETIPHIGVKKDSDGIYYWTLGGSWLLDNSGNKIMAEKQDGKNGATPQLMIANGDYMLSIDGGITWTNIGKASSGNEEIGYSLFREVIDNEENVAFILWDGTSIIIPRKQEPVFTVPEGITLEYELSDDTEIIHGDLLNYVNIIDSVTFTLDNGFPEEKKPKEGQIIIVPSTPEYPNGLLGRIVRGTKAGTHNYSLEPVSLEEAFDELEITGSVDMSDYVQGFTDEDGNSFESAIVSEDVWSRIDTTATDTTGVVVTKAAGAINASKTVEVAVSNSYFEGKFYSKIAAEFNLKIHGGVLQRFDIVTTEKNGFNGEFMFDLKKGKKVIKLIPTSTLPVPLGPAVLKPSLVLNFNLTLEGYNAIKVDVSHVLNNEKVELHYSNGTWTSSKKELGGRGGTNSLVKWETDGSVMLSLDAYLRWCFFNEKVLSAGFGVRPYIKLTGAVSINPDDEKLLEVNPEVELETGCDVYVSAWARLLSFMHLDKYELSYAPVKAVMNVNLLTLFKNMRVNRKKNGLSTTGNMVNRSAMKQDEQGVALFKKGGSVPVSRKKVDGNTCNVAFDGLNDPKQYELKTYTVAQEGKVYYAPIEDQDTPHITKFVQTDSDKGDYYYEGKHYDYKFECSTTVTLDKTERTVVDWGYVYEDPDGEIAHISLKSYSSPYTDTCYVYYRNEKESTARLYAYVKYEGDDENRYDDPCDYQLVYKDGECCPDDNHIHAIDLGLSVKWACCNVGASKPEEEGGYFAWGETSTKTDYSVFKYKHSFVMALYIDSYDPFTYYTYDDPHHLKYNCHGRGDAKGGSIFIFNVEPGRNDGLHLYFINTPDEINTYEREENGKIVFYKDYIFYNNRDIPDNKIQLEPCDDAASAVMGGNWRMPTKKEYDELIANCTAQKTTLNGIKGIKFTSKIEGYTDKWIFMPYTDSCKDGSPNEPGKSMSNRPNGMNDHKLTYNGLYWTSSLLYSDDSYPYNIDETDDLAYCFSVEYHTITVNMRHQGCSVRAVCPK